MTRMRGAAAALVVLAIGAATAEASHRPQSPPRLLARADGNSVLGVQGNTIWCPGHTSPCAIADTFKPPPTEGILPVRRGSRVVLRTRVPAVKVEVFQIDRGNSQVPIRPYVDARGDTADGLTWSFRVPRGERRGRELDVIVQYADRAGNAEWGIRFRPRPPSR